MQIRNAIVFSRSYLPTQPLSEFLFHQDLIARGIDSKFLVFDFDLRLQLTTTHSRVHPRSLKPLQEAVVPVSASRWNLLPRKSIRRNIRDSEWLFCRPLMKGPDHAVMRALGQHPRSKPKLATFTLSSIGAGVGSIVPDSFLCPGTFWEERMRGKRTIPCGLEEYNLPFDGPYNHPDLASLIQAGLMSWYDIHDSFQSVTKKQFLDAYKIKKRYIVVCLESSTKYISEKGDPYPLLPLTFEMLKKIKSILGEEIQFLFKPHPFQYHKPYPTYDRKQISPQDFLDLGEILDADDGYHALRFCDFALVWNSSMIYEAALCGASCVTVATKESDFTKSDGIFYGGFFTPKLPGFVFKSLDSFYSALPDLSGKINRTENAWTEYSKRYGDRFQIEKMLRELPK